MCSSLVVAKPVSWTLDPDWPRKTGRRYNDTFSCFGKPKGSAMNPRKDTFAPRGFSIAGASAPVAPAVPTPMTLISAAGSIWVYLHSNFSDGLRKAGA